MKFMVGCALPWSGPRRPAGGFPAGEFIDRCNGSSPKGFRVTSAPSRQPVPDLTGPPEPDLVRIRDLIYQVAGIFHPDSKLRLLQDRCSRRMKDLKMQTLHEYLEC